MIKNYNKEIEKLFEDTNLNEEVNWNMCEGVKLLIKQAQIDAVDDLITTLSMIRIGSIEGDLREEINKYAKWYAEKVIDRCAEVARTGQYSNQGSEILVDKQSILKVKEEL